MNKAELVEALTARLGDRKTATTALEALLEEIQRTVSKGGKISLAGFGVFEKRARAARTARNPRTGEAVKVKKTSVPAFRPGQGFKDVVRGKKKIAAPKKAAKKATGTAGKKAAAKKTTGKAAGPSSAKRTTGRKTAAKATTRTSAAKSAAAKKTTTRKTTAKKAPAKRTATKRAPVRTTATRSAAKRTPRKR